MSEGNGKPDKQAGTGDRKSNGQFVLGQSGNPAGRPKSIDYRRVCEEKAEEEGYDLETAIWEVTKELISNAKGRPAIEDGDGKMLYPPIPGDTQAQRLLFDRQCGPMPSAGIEVNVDARQVHLAPPVPEGKALGKWVKKLNEVAEQQGFEDDES